MDETRREERKARREARRCLTESRRHTAAREHM
jgi:hypothetical protein